MLENLKATLGKAIANLPFVRQANLSARHELPNVASSAKVAQIQSYIRAAEQGDPTLLFAYYRDVLIGSSHLQSEFGKRKLAILGDTLSILPCDKSNKDDLTAAQACREAIEDCENWMDGMTFLMDSCLYPVSVAERLYAPAEPADDADDVPLRYTLKRFEPVNYSLLCFRGPYQLPNPPVDAPATWEADLRLWPTNEAGAVMKDVTKALPLDPMRHIVHRGHLLIGVRDNWGGPFRSIIFWNLLAQLGRDWFGRLMERYGNPFIVAKTDKTDKDGVTFLEEALSLSTKIGGLVVDEATQIELKEAVLSGAADGYEKFLGVCNREISKVIVGQDLSAQSAPTGLGSGVANLQAGVRQDIRMFDQLKLAETIQNQVLKPFLKINGLKGSTPKIRWGGLSPEEAAQTGALLVSLANANLEPTDEAIDGISERVGFAVQRKAAPPAPNFGGGFGFGPNASGAATAATAATFRARLATFAAQTQMATNLGVPPTWLNPLRDLLAEIETKVADQSLTEKDLLDFLDTAVARVPELFKTMNVDDLAKLFESAMGSAVIGEVRKGIRQGKG